MYEKISHFCERYGVHFWVETLSTGQLNFLFKLHHKNVPVLRNYVTKPYEEPNEDKIKYWLEKSTLPSMQEELRLIVKDQGIG